MDKSRNKPDAIALNTMPCKKDPINSVYGSLLDPEDIISIEKQEKIDESKSQPNDHHKRAALLVKEGRDNERFDSLPSRWTALTAYRILHNPFYYWLALILACTLILLAILEQPSKDVHSVVVKKLNESNQTLIKEDLSHFVPEIVILVFFFINLFLRFIWLGHGLFFKSRAPLVFIIVTVMFIEAIVDLPLIYDRHMRFTRALRPFILLDTYLMFGTRRVIRQILLCLKNVIDVMFVLFFIVAVFSLVGYFLFKENNPTYFGTLEESLVSMIITLTTANHPDVFMEAYYHNPWSPLFFMIYMFVTYYYFLTVLLAVIFAKFKAEEEKKYKKLFLHKREALHRAFELLKEDENDHIIFLNFFHFMRNYSPRIAPSEVMCFFKALKSSDDNVCLTWDEFSNFYDHENMKWELTNKTGIVVGWYEKIQKMPLKLKKTLHYIHVGLNDQFFDAIITVILLANLLYLFIFIILTEDSCCDIIGCDQFCAARKGIIGSFIFNIIYLVEVNCRLLFDGPTRYFRKWWNWIDYIIIMGSFICLCVETGFISNYCYYQDTCTNNSPKFIYIAIIRPLKLLRLLRLKKNYFFLIRILLVLARRLISVFFLLFIVIYFFSIIGMEVFSGKPVGPNCCENASFDVGEYYLNSTNSYKNHSRYFWLNNFDNLSRSIVILYEEMVVNNWFIQMEGFVSTTSHAARLYFILFWMITIVVVNIAIVYIVDAFESALKASGTENDSSIAELKRVIRIVLTDNDINELKKAIQLSSDKTKWYSINRWIRKRYDKPVRIIEIYKGEFRGKRIMNNDDLRFIIYESEIEKWRTEYDEKCSLSKANQQHKNSLLSSIRQSTSRDICKNILIYIGSTLKQFFLYVIS